MHRAGASGPVSRRAVNLPDSQYNSGIKFHIPVGSNKSEMNQALKWQRNVSELANILNRHKKVLQRTVYYTSL